MNWESHIPRGIKLGSTSGGLGYTYAWSRPEHPGEAARYLDRVSREKPDFSSRARELMRRTVKEDSIVDEVIDGLREADLTVESR